MDSKTKRSMYKLIVCIITPICILACKHTDESNFLNHEKWIIPDDYPPFIDL